MEASAIGAVAEINRGYLEQLNRKGAVDGRTDKTTGRTGIGAEEAVPESSA